MSNSFVPHQEEETVTVVITKREAQVIQQLREYQFVKLLVHKSGGLIVRTEINESKLIEETGKITLPIVER
jgi:hypothetical protein